MNKINEKWKITPESEETLKKEIVLHEKNFYSISDKFNDYWNLGLGILFGIFGSLTANVMDSFFSNSVKIYSNKYVFILFSLDIVIMSLILFTMLHIKLKQKYHKFMYNHKSSFLKNGKNSVIQFYDVKRKNKVKK